ncbi:amidohydrolase family protein [Candidatus Desantisbacteria bacterium]|nr:amidohydrolase family protein [Candidatus Desantisbacteria bacterium]
MYIITLEKNYIYNGAILIKGAFIQAIGKKKKIMSSFPDEPVKDIGEAIIFPGFINAHTHLQFSKVKISSTPVSFTEWLPKMIAINNRFTLSDWKKSTNYGIKKLTGTGITALADISRSKTSFKALASYPYHSLIFYEVIAPDEPYIKKILKDIRKKIILKDKSKINIGVSPHALYCLSLSTLKQISSFAKKYSIPVMIHVSETKEEMELIDRGTGYLKELMTKRGLKIKYGYKKTPVEILAENGILNSDTIIVHGVHLTKQDLSLLKYYNASVVLCPKSNKFLKTGTAPVRDLFNTGITLALGTDSLASNDSFNMFEEMHEVKKIYNKIHNKDLLKMATLNGAKALNISASLGSLSTGKFADINAVKIKKTKKFDPYQYLCEETNIEDISLTMIRGKIFYSKT